MPRVKSFKPKESKMAEESSVDELVGNQAPAEGEGMPQPQQEDRYVQTPRFSPPGERYPRYGGGGSRDYQDSRRDYQDSQRDVPTEKVSGILDIMPEGHGFLRPKFNPSDQDVYIASSQIRRFQLRAGDLVEGMARPPKETERYFGLLQVTKINEDEADKIMTEDGR